MKDRKKLIERSVRILRSKPLLLLIPLVALGLIAALLQNSNIKTDDQSQNAPKENTETQEAGSADEVLGHSYQSPQIYIYGGNEKFTSGGLIALASTDEPAVRIGGYDISGEVKIDIYEANEESLLAYLVHDEDGNQTNSEPDVASFTYVTTVNETLNSGSSLEGNKITLPLKETGIWYLRVKVGSVDTDAYVLRSNIGVLTREGDNEFVLWGQNFKTKRSIPDGTAKILNLQNGISELQAVSFNNEGIARATLTADADIALIEQGNDRAIIPINLRYLNTSYSYEPFQPKGRVVRYFIFTDRPLYKPGDTIYFKSVLRDDDDARYSLPQGQATVSIYNGWYYEGSDLQPVFEQSYPISGDGTIDGEYVLPETAKVGQYTLVVKVPGQSQRVSYWDSEWSSNAVSFNVEYFKKPEFSIDVTTSETELISADASSFTISGTYFSGQPLSDQKVKYVVYSSDFYEYQYLSDQEAYSTVLSDKYRYGYSYGDTVMEGVATLDRNGEAVIEIDTKTEANQGKSQVYSIEATIEDGSLTPSFARRNVLVRAGEFGIYRQDTSYGTRVNTQLSLPVKLVPYKNNLSVSGVKLTAKIHRENWIPYQEINKKYPSYRKEEEDLKPLSATTDSDGNASFSFTPQKIGSYTITIEGEDSRGNEISKIFYSYVSEQGQPFYDSGGNADISVISEKQRYGPAETARLNIFSSIPDRDVLLSLERGRVSRFQVVRLTGKNGTVDLPLQSSDIPNIYATVTSFSDHSLDSNSINIPVSADEKKLLVNITPNSDTFGPGETVTVNVATTDVGGNPVSAELALWTVDKAIFELSSNKLGDIFDKFWSERYNSTQNAHSLEGIVVRGAEGGGCFAAGTTVLMGDGTFKNIEDVRVGEFVLTRTETDQKLVKAKVLETHKTDADGYLIINSSLRVTANHIMWVNGSWREAGSVQPGDILTNANGENIYVESLEWQRGAYEVYNLEIEGYHTYFADGFWVHNQKGVERNAFKDTAYWNPRIRTDASGRAQVSFQLPDNLTTWTLAAVGATSDTKVGQNTTEIVVTKDVIVRPILPNILRVGDEIYLSALVQNYTETDQTFDIGLDFDSGEVEDAVRQDITISPDGREQFFWKVRPLEENDSSKLVFSARVVNNENLADVVTQEIPVRAFGFEEKKAETGEGNKTFQVRLAPDTDRDKSSVTLTLSPTILGTIPTAMEYLINYPYGCVEQTTSRLAPAIIAKANPSQFASVLEDRNVDEIIEEGVSRLSTLQKGDGGWSWWYQGDSDYFITAYVTEYLLQAQELGIEVDQGMLQSARGFLERDIYASRKDQREELIAKSYGLAQFDVSSARITDLENLSPDILSLAVMTNYLNGDTNPESNGLNKLLSLAQKQGDAIFWEAGDTVNFGSEDASTALAIRAVLLAGGDREIAVSAARYLTRTRQSEYWSNTYATSQVMQALVELSKTGNELTPNYSYTVQLDGNEIAEGFVTNPNQSIEIEVPVTDLQSGFSSLSVEQVGEGQMYLTLLVEEFRTDRNAIAETHGMTIEREYVNEKGEQYTLAVGDTAIVRLTVGGLQTGEHYGVIKDELPSGLVPINQTFENEQYNSNPHDYYYNSYNITDREITENGAVLSLYRIPSGTRTYTYKARVVSEGTFSIPPATTSLMYAPEIYGRSEAQVLTVTKESQIIPGKVADQEKNKVLEYLGVIAVLILIIVTTGLLIMKKRGKGLSEAKEKATQFLKRKKDPGQTDQTPKTDESNSSSLNENSEQ